MKKTNLLLILQVLIIKLELTFIYNKLVALEMYQAASHNYEIVMQKKKGYLSHNFLKFCQT